MALVETDPAVDGFGREDYQVISRERTPDGGLIGGGGTTVFKTWPDGLDAPPSLDGMAVDDQGIASC